MSRPPWPASRITRTPASPAGDLGTRELRGLGLLPRALQGARVVLREELLGQVFHRDLHGEADRNRVDVLDAGARGDRHGEVVHVDGVEAAREAHDDGRIERLALAQPVDGVPALLVLIEDEVRGLRVGHGLGVAERVREKLHGNPDRGAGRNDVARERVLLRESRRVPGRAGEPLGDVGEALLLHRDVKPARRRAHVGREERRGSRRASTRRKAPRRRARRSGCRATPGRASTRCAVASSFETRRANSTGVSPSRGRASTVIAPSARWTAKSRDTSTRRTAGGGDDEAAGRKRAAQAAAASARGRSTHRARCAPREGAGRVLEDAREREEKRLRVARPDELHPDGKPVTGKARRNRDRGQAREARRER